MSVTRTLQSSKSLRPPSAGLLGPLLVLLIVAAVGLVGSTRAWALAILHGLAFSAALVAVRLPDAYLARCGAVMRLVPLSLVPLAVVGLGLLPLPAGVLAVVAPGVVLARPQVAWWTLSLAPVATLSELSMWMLMAAVLLLAGVWGAHNGARPQAERVLVFGLAGIVLVAVLHALGNAKAAFGLIPIGTAPHLYLGPLVNPNHLGTLLLLLVPPVAGLALLEGSQRIAPRPLLMGVAASGLLLLLATRSPGTVVAGVMALAATTRPTRVPRGLLLAGGALLAGALCGAWLLLAEPGWFEGSVLSRLAVMRQLPRMAGDFWLAGTGGGAFGVAFPPYDVSGSWSVISHVHSQLLEWLVEGGLAGSMGLVLAVRLRPRWTEARAPDRTRLLHLGLLAVGLHCLVDFPLEIPGILACVVAIVALRSTAYEERRETGPSPLRRVLVGLAVLQLAGMAIQGRQAVEDTATRRIQRASQSSPAVTSWAETLGRVAWWSPELTLLEMRLAAAEGRTDDAIREALAAAEAGPQDAGVLRAAAVGLVAEGALDPAEAVLRRSIQRGPSDFRSYLVLAEVLERRGDVLGACEALLDAMRRWPPELVFDTRILGDGFDLLPVGAWWLEGLADAPPEWSVHLARHLLSEGEVETAIEAYVQAGSLSPRFAGLPELGGAYNAAGRPAEAEAFLRGLLEEDPADVPALWHLFASLVAQERGEEAYAVAVRAYEIEPDNPRTRRMLLRGGLARGGVPGLMVEARRLEVSGRLDDELGLEIVRMLVDAEAWQECLESLEHLGLLDRAGVSEKAGRLQSRCREMI